MADVGISAADDVELTLAELRAVARFAVAHAAMVLPVFTAARPDDPRPADAVTAARAFVDGGRRSMALRAAATGAHRAAAQATGEPAQLAARAAGDAAAAAYLHPIPRATQVGHILRSAACVVRIAEIGAPPGDEAAEVERALAEVRRRADPVVIDVLRRYPPTTPGRDRLGQLLTEVDVLLRTGR